MAFTIHINDISNPEAKAFWEYAKSLKFVTVEEDEISLTKEQTEAIEDARKSLKKNGGKSNDEVMDKMKKKFPNAFRA